MNKEQKMNAWVLEDLGRICYKEQDMPSLGEREVLVAVKAAGICGSDIPRIYRTGAYHYPLIPGHEFSGQVVQVQFKRVTLAQTAAIVRRLEESPLVERTTVNTAATTVSP